MSTEEGTAHLSETEISLGHLYAELARIDVLVSFQVRRWQLAGQDLGDRFRGLHLSAETAEALIRRPFGANWGDMIALDEAEQQAFADAYGDAVDEAARFLQAADELGTVPRPTRLAESFELDRFDLDALLVCMAPSVDVRFEQLYGFLQDDVTRKQPSISLVLDLLGPGEPIGRLALADRFSAQAPLFRHSLLERSSGEGSHDSFLGQPLRVDEAIIAWLLGSYQPHALLGAHAALVHPQEDESSARLVGDGILRHTLERCADPVAEDQPPPIVVLYGQDQLRRQAAAERLGTRAGRPLLRVDLAAVAAAGTDLWQAVKLSLRDARLTGTVPVLDGWDTAAGSEPGADPRPSRFLAPELVTELCRHDGLVVISGQRAWQPAGIERQRTVVSLEFAEPTYTHRRALWTDYLQAQLQADVDPEELDLLTLAGQFTLTAGQIRDAVASARDRTSQELRPVEAGDLFAAARAHSSPHLGTLARKITPRYTWEDIVLPDDQIALLHEIVATVRGRPQVLEEWGVGRKLTSSSGVTMLFSGEPGTGKTMAAEIMAGELGLDLYKIDLSTVVSKYIGETEKNLEKIFAEAQNSNAILFFDEADAIFGKRSEVKDAHDRYANLEISYLLQRMEMYDGVTILATNLRANLDEAFTRRLQFAVDFPYPDETYRLRIWRTLFPADVPHESALDFEYLARHFKMAGGNIRNVLVGAAYLAAADGDRLEMKHLLHGTRRELQKMGRLVNETDLST
jgi:hypothetical protein